MLTVANLNDSGEGSLRAALESAGRRKVEFTTAGTIQLETPITISNPDLTVQGHAAPAGGICVKCDSETFTPIIVEGQGITFRHMRFRPGPGASSSKDGLRIQGNATNLIFDHCSISWSIDELVDVYSSGAGTPRNIMFRDCIFSEALRSAGHPEGDHSMGPMANIANGLTFERCLFAHNSGRNPAIYGGRADIVNCVIYKSGTNATAVTNAYGAIQINYINNYQRVLAYTADCRNFISDLNSNPIQIYSSGNVIDNETEILQEPSDLIWNRYDAGDPTEYLVRSQFAPLYSGALMSAVDTLNFVLANAGATLPKRDAVDARIVADVQNRTGSLIDDPSEVGGWPDLTV